MKRASLFLFAALAAVIAFAPPSAEAAGTSVTLSWQLADSNTDGSALAATDIKETLISWRRPGTAAVVGSIRVAAPATSLTVDGLTCGAFEFTGTTVLKSTATSDESRPPVSFSTGITCKPNPPKGLAAS